MENNKGQTIFLSVIGIATLLVAIVGATFAWFSTTISGTDASATVTTASISALSLEGTTVNGENVLPGWTSDDASFKVSGTVTGDVEVPYTCTIVKATSNVEITDLQYRVSAADATDSSAGTWATVPSTATTLVTGTITATNAEDIYYAAVRFPETGVDQNAQQAGDATVTITCAITGGTVYYNNANAGGTTTEPTAE